VLRHIECGLISTMPQCGADMIAPGMVRACLCSLHSKCGLARPAHINNEDAS